MIRFPIESERKDRKTLRLRIRIPYLPSFTTFEGNRRGNEDKIEKRETSTEY
jgi:hypothetical protein